MTRLAAEEASRLDPYKFMATIGEGVIHPGGRASTEALLVRAAVVADSTVLDVGCGVGMTPKGFLSDEGLGRSLAVTGRVAARPANIRKMAWLMPRMAKAVPYMVVAATKPT